MQLSYFEDENGKEVKPRWPEQAGMWDLDEQDMLLYALLCDNVYAPELLMEDPTNRAYAGCYTVRDYQYPLNRGIGSNYEGHVCARSVGKTESIKNRALTHGFRRIGENLLITTPELIHLLPLTDAIEDRINSCRLTREFLDADQGRTGFSHRPFGVDFQDGTKIVGRIPGKNMGRGVKGQHQPDLILDEGQDYPDAGWTEVHEAQPLDAPIATPTGYRRMGDLAVGDFVLGVSGAATKIVDVLDHGPRETLRFTFADGGTVECDADHWWTVTCNRHAASGRWRTIRASVIAAALDRGRGFGSRKQPWFTPHPGVAHFAPAPDLRLPPYLLGALLGDGCFRKGSVEITVGDPGLLDHLAPYMHVDEEWVCAGRPIEYRLRKKGRHTRYGQPRTRRVLEELGLWGVASPDKRIPAEYLTSHVSDRLDLLQGLVDTDGNVDRVGAVRFTTSSKGLADDVEFLVRSLGGSLRRGLQVDRRGFLDMHTVRFRLSIELVPCRLSRKVSRLKAIPSDSMRRNIVHVDRIGKKPMRCIEVEAHDGLYLADGFTPTHNTVLKDHVDIKGNPDFSYIFYGVHSGARDTGFYKRSTTGGFKINQITAIMRPGWNAAEKEAAKAAYGGSQAPDYRRNILGEAGAAASPLFVTARLISCMDQDRGSDYNLNRYVHQDIHVEAFDELMLPIADVLDLPSGLKRVWAGADLGLTNSPTVIMIFSEQKDDAGRKRLRLVRRIHLNRMRVKQIRYAIYAIFSHFGDALQGFGIDETGLGFPIFQEIEDDENKPINMDERFRGYFFNSKVAVGLEKGMVTQDQAGNWRDQYGSSVTVRQNPLTLDDEYVVWMPMIEASTRYLREMVDTTFLELPFDPAVIGDMQGDTAQRVKRISGLKQKPNAFHILDAMRAFSMVYKGLGDDGVEAQMNAPRPRPVLEMTI